MRSIACLFIALPLYAQTAEQGSMKELIAEIRALRMAVEKATVLNTRTQVLVQWLEVQQAKADRIKADLEKATNAVAGFQAEQAHIVELMKRTESQMQGSTLPPEKREALAHDIATFKRRLADHSSRDSQLRATEAQVASDYRAALARVADLESKLERIERDPQTAK